MDASGWVYGLNVEFTALLGHPTIVRIFANNPDLFKVLLDHLAIIRILANITKWNCTKGFKMLIGSGSVILDHLGQNPILARPFLILLIWLTYGIY